MFIGTFAIVKRAVLVEAKGIVRWDVLMKYYKVSGNKEAGFRINIPMESYLNAMQPRAYTCAVMQDGTLVYQPVKS